MSKKDLAADPSSNVYMPMFWITEFHRKHNFKIGEDLSSPQCHNPIVSMWLLNAGEQLKCMSAYLEKLFESRKDINQDDRSVRAHLMLEELGEALIAMGNGDEVELADGLGDLLYVTYGCGVTFDIPLQSVLAEIQRSNMTKAVRNSADTRLRDKGASFEPPRIKEVINKYRQFIGKEQSAACDTQA